MDLNVIVRKIWRAPINRNRYKSSRSDDNLQMPVYPDVPAVFLIRFYVYLGGKIKPKLWMYFFIYF